MGMSRFNGPVISQNGFGVGPVPGSSTTATVVDSSGNVTGASSVSGPLLQAGSSGVTGSVKIYPATASKGDLKIVATNNTGNTETSITNAAMGQGTALTIPDPGAATANFVLDTGTATMASGAMIVTAKGTGTESSNAVTINQQSGVITTTSLTTAAGSSETITLTNSKITATSVVLVSRMGGLNTSLNFNIVAVPGSGSATITINNTEPTNALNGTVIFGFLVV